MVSGMKKLILFSICAFLCFFGGNMGAKFYLQKTSERKCSFQPARFAPSEYVLKNCPFTVVIVGHNNGATVEKTLSSVFFQAYTHFRLIYIDDASSDGSCDVARDAINRSDRIIPVTFVQNENKLGDLANIFRAVDTCEDHEIVVVLQGEDWLAHEWVLQRLNAYYSDPELWIATGSSIDYPAFQKTAYSELNNLRAQPVTMTNLKTFYAKLFKQVRESDFISSGQFLPACAELAYMTPMLEMAKDHFHEIPEILYIHNQEKTQREDREEKHIAEKYIRALDPYSPLKNLEVAACGE